MRNLIRHYWIALMLVIGCAAVVWMLPTGFVLGSPTTDIGQFADWRGYAAQTIRPVISRCGIRSNTPEFLSLGDPNPLCSIR